VVCTEVVVPGQTGPVTETKSSTGRGPGDSMSRYPSPPGFTLFQARAARTRPNPVAVTTIRCPTRASTRVPPRVQEMRFGSAVPRGTRAPWIGSPLTCAGQPIRRRCQRVGERRGLVPSSLLSYRQPAPVASALAITTCPVRTPLPITLAGSEKSAAIMNSVVGSLLAQALVRFDLHLRGGYHVPLRRGERLHRLERQSVRCSGFLGRLVRRP